MKLFFAPGACSLAPHIVLNETGQKYDLAKVDLRTHKVDDGSDYTKVNPKGYVPALVTDDGATLTEAAVVLQYLAERKPGTLAPQFGTRERWQLMEWLNFIATELHKGYGPLWNPATPDATRSEAKTKLAKRYAFIERTLEKQPFLTGERFSIADAYLFTVTNWAGMLDVNLEAFPAVRNFMARVAARPAVQAALAQEGLLEKAA
jgi:glutathione S-transferase